MSRLAYRQARVALLICLVLGTVQLARSTQVPSTSRSAHEQSQRSERAFAQLNRLRAQAQRASGLIAAWQIYHDAWHRSDGQLRYFIAQVIATMESELGLYAEAAMDHPGAALRTLETPAAYPDPQRYRAESATDALADLARDRRLLVVNEAHHIAQARWLSLELLPRLRQLGYTHFAAESLDPGDYDLAPRGYPVTSSGYYVREPLYGELVRRAIQLGFVVVAYESALAGADPDQRETAQADTLYKKVFANNSAARLFVHLGYAHAHERAGYLWNAEPMTLQLARRIGTDTISVDQSVLHAAAENREYGAYTLLLQDYAPQRPIVLREIATGQLWSLEPGYYDVSVVLPRGSTHNGRPDWLGLGGTRAPVQVSTQLCGSTLPCLIEARYSGESVDAVPADRWLHREAIRPIWLYLSPGTYRLRATAASGRGIGERNLQVSSKSSDLTIPSP